MKKGSKLDLYSKKSKDMLACKHTNYWFTTSHNNPQYKNLREPQRSELKSSHMNPKKHFNYLGVSLLAYL